MIHFLSFCSLFHLPLVLLPFAVLAGIAASECDYLSFGAPGRISGRRIQCHGLSRRLDQEEKLSRVGWFYRCGTCEVDLDRATTIV